MMGNRFGFLIAFGIIPGIINYPSKKRTLTLKVVADFVYYYFFFAYVVVINK